MPREGDRRTQNAHLYDILIVPVGEVGRTRSFRTNRLRIALLVILSFLASVCVTLAILVYTPLAIYVPIPNAGLEQRYGRQIVELQQRLNSLADDVLLLRDYNTQLRKALGEGKKDSTETSTLLPSVELERGEKVQAVDTVSHEDQPSDADAALVHDLDVPAQGGGELPDVYQERFPLLTPVEGFVTQGFDPARKHFGMDFAAARGTLVYAAADGRVVFSGWTYDDGNMIMISHGNGFITVYKHNQALLKSVPATVKRGEPIALLGSSGKTSLGPHLHFEVLKDGVPQDPEKYLLTTSVYHSIQKGEHGG